MSVRREVVKLLVFSVVALTLLWILWSTLLNTVGGDTRAYTAEFTDVSGLHEGDTVRSGGVRVGRVESMKLVGPRARVTFEVQSAQPMYENTRVVIRYQNLIGQRFLSLVPGEGSAPPLVDGAFIPMERTESSFDVAELLNGFQPLFTTFNPAEFNRLNATLVQVLQGSGKDIGPLLEQTAQLSNTIADRDKVITSVIDNLVPVLDQLSSKTPEFDRLLDQSERLVGGLNEHTGEIYGALEKVRSVTGTAEDLISDIRPDLRADLGKATEASDVFLDNDEHLVATLDGLPPFLAALGRTQHYGSFISLYACDLAIQIPGLPPDLLKIPDSVATHTEVCR
ncbi:MlaD family protein [Pseudonocardia eucalypti]|uniref:MlaD family protein n=1 Tax=Pseudonocardia eucalypti TaxID=648755 RepID=A0ABP9QE05_9PSEU|nr:phospholipid/cholesterol/gamma-HCH transport system substrate-binding protein [Pseudonocardia eucalypti]